MTGEQLKAMRLRTGLSQALFAEELRGRFWRATDFPSLSLVAKYETGKAEITAGAEAFFWVTVDRGAWDAVMGEVTGGLMGAKIAEPAKP